MSRTTSRSSILVMAAVGFAACSKPEPAADPAAATPAAPNVVHINATDFAFAAPDSLPSGVTTFHLMNAGKEIHHVVLVKVPMAELMKADPNAPPPPDLVVVGGANAAEPGATAESTVDLTPGEYTLVCFIPGMDGKPHMMKGMLRPLIVTQGTSTAVMPTPEITVKLVDYGFEFSAPLAAGRHLLRVENTGPQMHEMVVVKLAPGATAESWAKWAEKPVGPSQGTVVNGASPMTAGIANIVPVDLTPGEYALICFVADAKDGKLHLTHGMIKQITVM